MKQLLNWLVPPFLRRFDRYLLENYPSVWSTGEHFVLFYGVLAAVILFVAGFCYPASFVEPNVAPIEAIDIREEYYFLYSLVFVLIVISIWIYYYTNLIVSQRNNIRTLIAYALISFFFIAMNTTAFRVGMIFRTASFPKMPMALITPETMSYLKAEKIFSYGFLMDEQIKDFNHVLNFEEKESELYLLQNREYEAMKSRYGRLSFLFHESFREMTREDIPYNFNVLYSDIILRDSMNSWEELSYLLYREVETHIPPSLFRLFKDELDKKSSILNEQLFPGEPTSWGELDDIVNRVELWNKHKEQHNRKKQQLSQKIFLDYHNYYVNRLQIQQLDTVLIVNKLKIPLITDTIPYKDYLTKDTLQFLRPRYPYALEDGVRSIEHARQYLREGIVFRYYKSLLLHLLLLVFLLYAVPYSNFASILGVVLGYLGLVAGGLYFLEEAHAFIDYFHLLPTSLALLPLVAAWWQGKQTAWSRSSVEWFTVVVSFTLLGAFSETDQFFSRPSGFAFYGVQVLCVLVLFLHHRVRALPSAA